MNKLKKKIHMGSIVRQRVDELELKHVSVAKELSITRQSLDYLYKQDTINPTQLFVLSRLLNKDFFAIYQEALWEEKPSLRKSAGYVAEGEFQYSKKTLDRLIIDIENGDVTSISHVKEDHKKESDRILQLERMVMNLTDALKTAGLKVSY